jgi:hypothetical protein
MGINTITSSVSLPELAPQINNAGKMLTTDGNFTAWTQPSMTLIASTTGQPFGGYGYTGATPSQVTFQNIPQNFKHLKIVGSVIGLDTYNQVYMDVNNSTSAQWNVVGFYGNSVSSTSGYQLPVRIVTTALGGVTTTFEITIPGYSTTVSGTGGNYTNSRSYMSVLSPTISTNGSYPAIGGGWFNMSSGGAITGIQLYSSNINGKFTVSLYGMN